jgi:hypothetical protein
MKIKFLLMSIISLSAIFAQCDDIGGNSGWISDGYCDAGNNNETCEWDGGDCCESTCVDADYACDAVTGPCAANNCIDPTGNNDNCGEIGCAESVCGYYLNYGYSCDDLAYYDIDCATCEAEGACDGGGGGGTDGSCVGFCGENTGSCYCDDQCEYYGDCCPDYWDECLGDPDPVDQTGPPTNVNATGDFGSITVSWSAPAGGGGNPDPEGVGEACDGCGAASCITDCELQCVDEATANSWIADTYCDDGEWGMYLNCEFFNFDGGDCGTGGGGGGTAPEGWTCDESYYLDGWCDCGCGVYDADCDDPNATEWQNCPDGSTCSWAETECTEEQSCEDQGLISCWDGSCASTEDDCADAPYAGQDCCELVDCDYDPSYVGLILDCSLEYCFDSAELGDGECTDYSNAGYPGVGFNCEEFNFDNGDCDGVDPNECPAGFLDNCNADFEGASACCDESWIGDGYCDGSDQAYGCDLLCYEGEDADCSGGSPESGSTPTRSTFEKENGLMSISIQLTKESLTLTKEYYQVRNTRLLRPIEASKFNNNLSNQTNSRELLSYNLYRNGELLVADLSSSTTMYTDYDVMESSEYCYQLSSNYTEGESEMTMNTCASTLGAPDAMVSFTGNGSTGALDVHLNSSVDVAGFQFVVTSYPSSVTLTSAEGGMASDAGFQIQMGEDGIVLGFSFEGESIPAGEGTLVSLTFDYNGDADICLETVVLSDANGDPVSVGVGDCATTEMTVIMGDVNGDATINVLDIIVVVNSIIAGEELSPNEFAAADMNFDGSANVVDIIAIVNIILADGVAKGTSINEADVIVDSEHITIKSNGSIAGFELDVDGVFTINNSQLPSSWNLYYSDSKVLAFTIDGKQLSDEMTISYTGTLNVNAGIVTDLYSSVVNTVTTVIPENYIVSELYPNPFNPVTQFEYAIPEDVNVNITIYDASGSKVTELQNGFQNAGSYSASWDAGNQPSGIYFVRFIAGEFTKSEKVMLLK